MIKISNLQKKYGELEVLNNINLQIEDGEIYGLIGISGAGKSTLLRCINGIIPYDGGSLTVNGTEVKSLEGQKLREFRSRIGMVFQNFSLLERLNVYENVAFPMRMQHINSKEIEKRVLETIKLVGLEDKLKNKPKELSGGQKQRVAIARALVMNPKILLCDEATSALDPKTGKSILNLLKDINRKLGITIIVVTHQMSVVEQICDRMALLQHGKIVVNGPVSEVFLKSPAPLQELLGENEKKVSSNGTLFHVVVEEEEQYSCFFCDMVNEAGIGYRLISGGVREFKNGSAFSGVIETQGDNTEKLMRYLEARKIRFEVENYE